MSFYLKLQSVILPLQRLINRSACDLQKNIIAGATFLCLCLWQITQVMGYSTAVPTQTSLNSPNITVMIQDKPKMDSWYTPLLYTFWTQISNGMQLNFFVLNCFFFMKMVTLQMFVNSGSSGILKWILPQDENVVIDYLPPCRSKPVRASFIFGTRFKIF